MCRGTGVSNELPGREKAGPGPVALPGPWKGWDGVIEALWEGNSMAIRRQSLLEESACLGGK